MKYRPEIDGLRALAVIPVILFHSGIGFFGGGFVGVDVFFVISGYLITTILIEDIEKNRFSIASFYERRARRILPALFFVIIVSIPFVWMTFLPRDLKDFFESVTAVSLFGSNILFWKESGYFGTASELKPLLHTWSLAVEEQYYLLFPVFLFLVWRFGKTVVFWIILILALTSLLLSEWGWRHVAAANFFLAPTRAWELFAGSISAFIVQKRGVQKSTALSLLGLVAILYAIIAYDKNTPFPSLYTLVPVLGVVMIILFAGKETFTSRLLSVKVVVGIGLISYSAYLWHQPILAFLKYHFGSELTLIHVVVALTATVLLSLISFKYVETPFRRKMVFSRRKVFSFGVTLLVAFSLFGVVTASDMYGSLSLFRDDPYHGVYEKEELDNPTRFANEDGKNIYLWGDSYADDLIHPLASRLQQEGWGLIGYVMHSCPSLLGVLRNEPVRMGKDFSRLCFDHNESVRKSLEKVGREAGEKKFLIITSAYLWYLSTVNTRGEPILLPVNNGNEELNVLEDSLLETVQWARQNNFVPVVVLTHPVFENAAAEIRKNEFDKIRQDGSASRNANERLVHVLSGENVLIVDPVDVLCVEDESGLCNAYDKNHHEFIVWYDGSHLSDYGAGLLGTQVMNAIRGAQGGRLADR